MTEEAYSKREQDHFFGELFKRMDKQDDSLSKILEQTTRHNGRMSKIEDRISDYEELKKIVIALSNYKWWIVGFGAAFALTGYLAIQSIVKNTVQASISDIKQSYGTETNNQTHE